MLLFALIVSALTAVRADEGRHSLQFSLDSYELVHAPLVAPSEHRRSSTAHIYDLSISAFGRYFESVLLVRRNFFFQGFDR